MSTLVDQIGAEVACVAECAKQNEVQRVMVDFRELGRIQRNARSIELVDAWCITTMAGKKFVVPKQPR